MLYIKGSAYLIVFGVLSLGSLQSQATLLKQSAVQEKESLKLFISNLNINELSSLEWIVIVV